MPAAKSFVPLLKEKQPNSAHYIKYIMSAASIKRFPAEQSNALA
jgi:hypothetical protein